MSVRPASLRLTLSSLRRAYREGSLTPSTLVDRLAPALAASDPIGVWISRVDEARLREAALLLERERDPSLPLWGVPFAVKDNIDVAGFPTTAACPEFAYTPGASATVVGRLLAAGGLLVGKTNLDQFATGLLGVRSPYGAPPNPFDARYVTGGSSSGSASAVARGLATFALGTDTAGSGRVPAGFTNTVGLKPSAGVLSARGVVPACRSLDCVSVFALTVEDAAAVARVAAAYDAGDPYARVDAARVDWRAARAPGAFRFGIPVGADRAHCDAESGVAFERAIETLRAMGGVPVPVDFGPLFATAELLYSGPWIAERLAELEAFVARAPDAVLPVTREILLKGQAVRGVDAFLAHHAVHAHRQRAAAMFGSVDVLVVPTAPTFPTHEAVRESPIARNTELGRYTNFVNLLDLAALAVPNGMRGDGLPTGVTFIGPWGSDGRLAALGSAFHQKVGGAMGATGWELLAVEDGVAVGAGALVGPEELAVAVVGAHLSGQPLNRQLTERGARLVASTTTSARYRLYALEGTVPQKPGLVRAGEGGARIEVEVWAMPLVGVGSFLAGVPAPLCLGRVELEGGEQVTGFLCEGWALAGARDISAFGGWRAFLAS